MLDFSFPPGPEKRCVMLHCRGVKAGLYEIMGRESELPAGEGLPTFLPDVDFGDHQGSASLITTKTRFHLWRENTPLQKGKFGEELHPEQV